MVIIGDKMKKWLIAAAALLMLNTSAFAQNLLQRYEPGPRLIDGSQLNQIVDRLNNGTIVASYYFTGATAAAPTTAVDQVFFIASRAMRVISCREVHSVAAGGTSTLQVVKDTGTDAPGAGTDLLTTAFNLNGTANTVQTGALSTTVATVTLAAGNRLSVDFADAIQSSVGVAVTCFLTPLS
jgi:hypothetical protein